MRPFTIWETNEGSGPAGVFMPKPPQASVRRAAPAPRAPAHFAMRQTLEDSFSAVSKPKFASKYALERSRRDLQNALLCTVFGIHNRKLGEKEPGQNNPDKVKTRGHRSRGIRLGEKIYENLSSSFCLKIA